MILWASSLTQKISDKRPRAHIIILITPSIEPFVTTNLELSSKVLSVEYGGSPALKPKIGRVHLNRHNQPPV